METQAQNLPRAGYGVYSRPSAVIDQEGRLEVRASAANGCRRALWYSATEHQITNPTGEETLTVLEAGNALEPVVVRAMQRAGWEVTPVDSQSPTQVSVDLGPDLRVVGHPDATGLTPFFGDEVVIEVKTRGPEAFKRWQTLGAERSHPDAVAQAGFYSAGLFAEVREVVIATMDTGSRQWDYEIIPAERVAQALESTKARLAELVGHYVENGPDGQSLPDRDFPSGHWRCRSCPFLDTCLPGDVVVDEPPVEPAPEELVTDEEAQKALHEYEEIQATIKEFEEEKGWVLERLKAWLGQRGTEKAKLEGREKTRTVGMVQSRRYSVDYKKLNALLDPETRSQIVTEQTSEYLRVS